MQNDLLLQYTEAFDRGDFDAMEAIHNRCADIPGLDEAIASLHARFDSGESFTEQLVRYRDGLQQRSEKAGPGHD